MGILLALVDKQTDACALGQHNPNPTVANRLSSPFSESTGCTPCVFPKLLTKVTFIGVAKLIRNLGQR